MSWAKRVVGVIALCLLASGGTVAADPGPKKMSFEGGVGFGLFLPSEKHEFYAAGGDWAAYDAAGLDVALRAAFLPTPFLAVEGELNLVPISGDDVKSTILGFRLQALVQLPRRFAPFGLVGVGALRSSSDELGNDTDGIAYLGGGAKFYLTEKTVLRGEARLVRAPKFEMDADGKGTNHGEILVGLSVALGGKAAEEEAPPPDPDPDGDGILGAADQCPDEAGERPTGCPVRDSDGDGLNDPDDRCPNEAENVNGYEDSDGCPEEIPDSDGDGLRDPDDKCAQEAEDMDGFEDEDGCPDADNDGDGVTDDADKCPTEAGPVENKGCPDTDRDGDGVVDRLDNCPDEPGKEDNFGCKKKQLVQITQTQIQILDKVYFATNKARIRSKSNKLLNNVVAVLQAHPEITKIRIEGHTDSTGDPDYNQELSQKRADAVAVYLINKGVDAGRLDAVGFGMNRPIADNDTKDGREQNRRVEFNIVDE